MSDIAVIVLAMPSYLFVGFNMLRKLRDTIALYIIPLLRPRCFKYQVCFGNMFLCKQVHTNFAKAIFIEQDSSSHSLPIKNILIQKSFMSKAHHAWASDS